MRKILRRWERQSVRKYNFWISKFSYLGKHKNKTIEVDFLINKEGDIIPIEVKAGDNTTSKSLNYYINRYKPQYTIRLSKKNFGEANGIKSIPLYASFLI